jgi:hypothetical protein
MGLTVRQIDGRRVGGLGRMPHVPRDGLDQEAARATALDGPLHALDGVLGQQLQHADVLPRTRTGAVLPLQVSAQLAENTR